MKEAIKAGKEAEAEAMEAENAKADGSTALAAEGGQSETIAKKKTYNPYDSDTSDSWEEDEDGDVEDDEVIVI